MSNQVKIIVGVVAVVVVFGLGFMFMGGDTPQSLIDEAVEKLVECSEAVKSGDTDAMAECDEPSPDFEKRWAAVMEGLSEEEKAEWEKKAIKATLDALGGLEGLLQQ